MEINKEVAILGWLQSELTYHRQQRGFLEDHKFFIEAQVENKLCRFAEDVIQRIELWPLLDQPQGEGGNDE